MKKITILVSMLLAIIVTSCNRPNNGLESLQYHAIKDLTEIKYGIFDGRQVKTRYTSIICVKGNDSLLNIDIDSEISYRMKAGDSVVYALMSSKGLNYENQPQWIAVKRDGKWVKDETYGFLIDKRIVEEKKEKWKMN